MGTIFLYEDGQGNVIDEDGGPEPVDYIVDQNEFIVETIATHTEYLRNAVPNESSLTSPMFEKPKNEDIHMKEAKPKREYVLYTVQAKARFFDLKIEKCMTAAAAAAAAKQLCIHTRTAYRWVSQYNAYPDMTEHLLKQFHDLKVSRSTVNNFMGRECNLPLKKADFHSVERNSQAKIEERYDWVLKWENTDMNFLTNCVFLDESAFDINMKRSRAWSKKGTRAIVIRPTTRANTTSILGAISAAAGTQIAPSPSTIPSSPVLSCSKPIAIASSSESSSAVTPGVFEGTVTKQAVMDLLSTISCTTPPNIDLYQKFDNISNKSIRDIVTRFIPGVTTVPIQTFFTSYSDQPCIIPY
ncbi:hypothetical protein BC941DRAFT_475724 [Chlamydoabsidia padenii]|nr:hypothetical protein BC941DRAFT_475724 [Chlamydoabsidia padenii]